MNWKEEWLWSLFSPWEKFCMTWSLIGIDMKEAMERHIAE